MTRDELVGLLKNTVTYYPQIRQHKIGYFNLSNKDLRMICETKLGSLYNDLTTKEKRIFIDKLFIELRGKDNG